MLPLGITVKPAAVPAAVPAAADNQWAKISTSLAGNTYGASGRRIVRSAGGAVTHFQFGPGGKLIAKSDGAGATEREYIS